MNNQRIVRAVKTHSGFRQDIGIFVRSRWESNIARYLNYLKNKKQIKDWEYEAEVFAFPVERGNRFYKPDFKVYNNKGSIEFWEVKGYMDNNSRIKLDRMARYYPDIKIILIEKEQYKAISKWKKLIGGWE